MPTTKTSLNQSNESHMTAERGLSEVVLDVGDLRVLSRAVGGYDLKDKVLDFGGDFFLAGLNSNFR